MQNMLSLNTEFSQTIPENKLPFHQCWVFAGCFFYYPMIMMVSVMTTGCLRGSDILSFSSLLSTHHESQIPLFFVNLC